MKNMRYIGVTFLVLILFGSIYLLEKKTNNHSFNEMDVELVEYIERLSSSSSYSGAILIAKNNEVLISTAIGSADRDNNISNTVDTQFNLGSMNKMFTAVAVMQLVEKDEVGLNNTICDYLIDYPNEEVARKVTIHQLLTHTSGLGDFFPIVYSENLWQSLEEVVDYLPLFRDDPLLFEPGTQSRYSNAGYIVLGLIIEKVSGQSYFDYIRENIFIPCEMNSSSYLESERFGVNVAIGYLPDGRSNSDIRLLNGCPAGGGYSTVYDLYKFSNALLDGRLLGQECLEIMFKSRTTFPELGVNESYCYGLMSRGEGQNMMLGHGGGSPGVNSACFFLPDQGYILVFLANTDDAARMQINTVYELIQ